MPPIRPTRLTLAAALIVWACQASAVGLGELRTVSGLGEQLRAEIPVQLAGRETLDSSCFRLTQGGGDEGLPWLREGTLTFRKGPPAILEIRSREFLRDPILRLGIAVGCGHELQRDYTLLLSPVADRPVVPRPAANPQPMPKAEPRPPRRPVSRPATGESAVAPAPRLAPVAPTRRAPAAPMADRLVLSGGGDDQDPSLRLATALHTVKGGDSAALEAQRDILRLEFRTLLALNEQAISQLAAAEKLRNMEASLAELQQRAGEFAQRVETPAAEPAPPAPLSSAPQLPSPAPAAPPPAETSAVTEWSVYGLLLGAALGIAGWLAWQRQRQTGGGQEELAYAAPEVMVDPRREEEIDEPGGVDLPVEPAAMGMPMVVDVPLEAEVPPPPAAPPATPTAPDFGFSIAAATLHEHFEANPVMELAEIMLSFGRVKGAAQALQEFIDNNPNEALQPWIKLLDVYRLAGMRDEFERVAENLNRHFNVEIQQWDAGKGKSAVPTLELEIPDDEAAAAGLALVKPSSLDELPHICQVLTESWRQPECSDYLHKLLRDNRGGKRSGFPLAVTEEILFLIELRETMAQMDAENADQPGVTP